jgi:hypothetical protein
VPPVSSSEVLRLREMPLFLEGLAAPPFSIIPSFGGSRRKSADWCQATRARGTKYEHRLNRILRGWSAYFSYGAFASAYEALIDMSMTGHGTSSVNDTKRRGVGREGTAIIRTRKAFLEWGLRTIEAMEHGNVRPDECPTYLLQYYCQHLEDNEASPGQYTSGRAPTPRPPAEPVIFEVAGKRDGGKFGLTNIESPKLRPNAFKPFFEWYPHSRVGQSQVEGRQWILAVCPGARANC